MSASQNNLFQKELVNEAFKQSFVKLNPKIMFKNPVMFTVEIGTIVMFFVCLWILSGEASQGSFMYNFIVFLVSISSNRLSRKEIYNNLYNLPVYSALYIIFLILPILSYICRNIKSYA